MKLVTRYDGSRNEYTVFRHNLTPEEANEAVLELSARLFGFFIVDQDEKKHAAEGPEECAACRQDVERSARVEPQPSFKRRQE
ncbi:MAG TPA: hypothetical protein VI386_08225 [Candidatus Sulfotelmatobacter sp.]